MCKATPLQHHGLDVTPEATLQFKDGGRLQFRDRYVMHHLAMDLGYPFYLHEGFIYSSQKESVKIAAEGEVFQAALPMCKGKAALAAKTSAVLIPIAVAT